MQNNYGDGLEHMLVLDCDRDRAARSARALAAPGRIVYTGCDAALGALLVRRVGLSALVTEAQIAGPFVFDGLEVVDGVRRMSKSCRIVVTGDDVPTAVANEAVRRGASGVFQRPFDDASLRDCVGVSAAGQGVILHIPTIEEFVRSEHLRPAFQPIVDLANGRRETGYESLARYRQDDLPFCDPCFLFEYARGCDKIVELDLECLRRTLAAAPRYARDGKVFINIHPRVLSDGDRFARTLVGSASDSGVPLNRVVLEITEQEKVQANGSTIVALEELRAVGVEYALDDVGASYAHLDLIDRIRPTYLKISHEFGTDFEKDASRRKIVRNILALATDFDCEIILEGVESEATSRAAAEIGARYAQGFLYAEPRQSSQYAAGSTQ